MQGVQVLDFCRVLAGPWASQHLADQGADVTKVEPPGGDETRAFVPKIDGVSSYFVSCNRNKASIVLDLSTEAGRSVALDLIDRADVVLHNYRPGVAERLGIGWSTVQARNPRAVYVHLSAFGSDADPQVTGRAGYDLVLQAMGGGMSITGQPGEPPVRAGTPVADLVAGLLMVQAVLHGLLQRASTGVGQRIEVNMMQAQAACLVYHATRFSLTGEVEVARGNAHRGLAPYDTYRCSDGWLAVAVGNDRLWQRLRGALGLEDQPTFRTNRDRVEHRERLDAVLEPAFAALTVEHADRLLSGAGVPVGPVLHVGQASEHPAVTPIAIDHPELGTFRAPGPVFRTAATRTVHRPPPALGADRDAVLASLGYGQEKVRRLVEEGAFGSDGEG